MYYIPKGLYVHLKCTQFMNIIPILVTLQTIGNVLNVHNM